MNTGDTVLTSEIFSHIISPSSDKIKACDYCLFSTNEEEPDHKKLNRCSNCQEVYYCGKSCQKLGWTVHKDECKFLVKVKPNRPPPTGRYLIRTLIKLKRGGLEQSEQLPNGTSRRFMMLMTHEEEVTKDPVRMEAFTYYIKMVEMCFGVASFDSLQVFQVFCRLLINSVGIEDSVGNSLGTGLYLALSAVDHSCRPNVGVMFSGRSVSLRALQPVPEPVLANVRISYINDENLSKEERQEILMRQYYFTCTCSKCEEEK